MSVQLIVSTDKLQSGFRAKYNDTANEIWISAADNGSGSLVFTKFNTTAVTVPLTSSFFTKAEIIAMFATITEGILVTDIADGSGQYDATGDGIPQYPNVTIYGADDNTSSAFYNNGTQFITGLSPGEAFNAIFR